MCNIGINYEPTINFISLYEPTIAITYELSYAYKFIVSTINSTQILQILSVRPGLAGGLRPAVAHASDRARRVGAKQVKHVNVD